ncbi:MAG TPA: LysR family transcriptional regulator [Bacillales bacterium]|nr:LysR family transcriptional regulator [Bacillales bacterium]
MDTRWLRTFVVAAHFENFRQAAERLFIAQPTVTVHIRHLEQEVGASLFERTGRNIRLTEAGKRFLPYAEKTLEHHDLGLQRLLSWRQGYEERLSLAVSPLIAGSILPYVIRQFTERHPHTEIIVQVAESIEIGAMIEKGEADLGLSRIKPSQAQLSVGKLYNDPIICVAPHDGGDFESSPPLDLAELCEELILFTYSHPNFWDELLATLRSNKLSPRTMVVTQVNVTKRFIEEGLGFSFLPQSSVRRELMEGRLLEVDVTHLDLPTAATYLLTRNETKIVTKFKSFLGEYYTE